MRKLEPLFANVEQMSRRRAEGGKAASAPTPTPAPRRDEPQEAAGEDLRLAIASGMTLAGGIRKVLGIPYL